MIEKIAERVVAEMARRDLKGFLPAFTIACEEAAKVPEEVLAELTPEMRYNGQRAFGDCSDWFTPYTNGAISIAVKCGINPTDTARLTVIGLVTAKLVKDLTGRTLGEWISR